jgi:hypothetical protein
MEPEGCRVTWALEYDCYHSYFPDDNYAVDELMLVHIDWTVSNVESNFRHVDVMVGIGRGGKPPQINKPSALKCYKVLELLPTQPRPGALRYYVCLASLKLTPWPLVRKRTIPTDRPPLVDEI